MRFNSGSDQLVESVRRYHQSINIIVQWSLRIEIDGLDPKKRPVLRCFQVGGADLERNNTSFILLLRTVYI